MRDYCTVYPVFFISEILIKLKLLFYFSYFLIVVTKFLKSSNWDNRRRRNFQRLSGRCRDDIFITKPSDLILSSLSSSVFALGVNLLYSVMSTYILYLPHSSLLHIWPLNAQHGRPPTAFHKYLRHSLVLTTLNTILFFKLILFAKYQQLPIHVLWRKPLKFSEIKIESVQENSLTGIKGYIDNVVRWIAL